MRILQITDTHLFPDADERLAGVDTRASLAAVLDAAFAEHTPDLLLATGDLAQEPATAAYEQLRAEIARRYSGPLCALPGNHDEPEQVAERLAVAPVTLGSWTIVPLDSHVPGEERGELSAAELERLERTLQEVATEHVLVGVHHPPLEVGSPLDHGRIGNGAQLLARLAADERVRGVVFGHIHREVDLRIGNLRLLESPSTCVQFKPLTTAFALDTQPPGYRWLVLADDGTIRTRVARLPAGSFPAGLT